MKKILSLFFLLIVVITSAQEKRLTLEDATGLNPRLRTPDLSQLQWLPKSNQFVFVANNALVQGEPTSTKRDTLVRLSELNTVLKFSKFDTLKRFPEVMFTTKDQFRYVNGQKLYQCNIMNNNIELINSWDEKSDNRDIGKSTGNIAFTRDNNLYITVHGEEKEITHETNRGIVYGSNRVHRNEFGIEKGTFWSPEENLLAFYRMDETMVAEYPLVDETQRIAAVFPTRYPMAGMTSHQVSVGVYDLKSEKIIYLQTEQVPDGDTNHKTVYLTNVTWSPDQQYIFIATLNRDQNFMQLNQYSAADGRFVKTIFREEDPAYVEPLHGPRFIPGNNGQFVWESRRDGFNHLYLYDLSTGLVRQLTQGNWEVTDFIQFDDKGKTAFFIGNNINPLERQLWKIDFKTYDIKQITDTIGTHYNRISYNGKYIIDSWSSTRVSRQIEVLDENGSTLQVLLQNTNPLKDYKLGETDLLMLKSEDQQDLYCRLIKPVDFDASKKYPVIIYVYGGPHSQLVSNTWLAGGGLFLNYLADQGYVVFTLDNRGTSNRGKKFEQAIFRHLGDKEVLDQMVGVKFLKSLPYVDSTRIGINGWSYGGFMTLSMMLRNPGVFKVAVCGGPVVDWKYYEVMYGERYMDMPQSNPDGYEKACLTGYVKNLKGKLLIIHDDQDGTVVPQNSFVFLKKCVDEGKRVDFFMYPGHEHNVRGKDRKHLNDKIIQYFNDYL